MSFLSDWQWHGYAANVCVFLGACGITLAFWPGFYRTYKTKNTKGLPITLFSLFLLVGILMTAGSIAGVCQEQKWESHITKGWMFVYLNSFVMFVNAYTVGLWWRNKKKERSGNEGENVTVVEQVQTI